MTLRPLIHMLREEMTDKDTFILIGIPPQLARHWPKDRGGGDTTPPHFTLLFIGKYDQAKKPLVLRAVKEVAKEFKPFQVVLEPGISWFTSHDESLDNREIAHKKPDEQSTEVMAAMHDKLRAAVERVLGHKVKHFQGSFKAHSTLRYEKERKYTGRIPEGSWVVREIELRSGSSPVTIPIGS